jgi:death-on-curing protein
MIQPRWLTIDEVLRLHEIQILTYGGQAAIRDPGLLEAAVLRPQNKHYYEQVQDIVQWAATYAVAISANHPFFDGDKRRRFMLWPCSWNSTICH